jgi:hypothetical protein
VAAHGDPRHQIGAEVQSGAAVRHEGPHEVVVAVAESGQLGDTAAVVRHKWVTLTV